MDDLTFYLLTVPGAFVVLSIAGRLWNPKVKWETLHGKNGENSLFHIAVDPDARYARAVLAQEIAERRWKWARGFGIPGLQLILQNVPAMGRAMELWGHEVEVQAAALIYGVDETQKRRNEARSMSEYSGYEFKSSGWPSDRIEREMAKRAAKARKWVRKNLKLIEEA